MSNCSAMVTQGQHPSDACLAAAAHHIKHDLELFDAH